MVYFQFNMQVRKIKSKLYNSQNNQVGHTANRLISTPGFRGKRNLPAQGNKKFIKLEPNVNDNSLVIKPTVQLLPKPPIRQNMTMSLPNGPSGLMDRLTN